MSKMKTVTTALAALTCALLVGCVVKEASSEAQSPALAGLLTKDALVGEPTLVDCTLSGGARTKCLAITVKGHPSDHAVGPWCPKNVADSKQAGGIWLDGGKVHDVDGAFVKGLATFYRDPTWQLFDAATGKVKVTDTKAACLAAARPDVDPAYKNHCVQCLVEYMDHSSQQTYVIPIAPVPSARSERVGSDGVGVALNGVRLDAPAPVSAILGAHTLAPFDDCGGHVNPHVGYHYHAAGGCSTQAASPDGHAPVIGVALDGYRIHARTNSNGAEPSDVDACRGHTHSGLGYHYHANDAGKNAILNCHTGQTGCANTGSNSSCDAANRPRRPPPPAGGQEPRR